MADPGQAVVIWNWRFWTPRTEAAATTFAASQVAFLKMPTTKAWSSLTAAAERNSRAFLSAAAIRLDQAVVFGILRKAT